MKTKRMSGRKTGRVAKRKRQHYCQTCKEPRPRAGTCADCRKIRELLSRIHKQDWADPRVTEAEDTARRVEIHRARANGLRSNGDAAADTIGGRRYPKANEGG